MQLLERDAEVRALAQAATSVAADGGRLVLIEGEPGVGKTSLVRAFLDGLPEGTPVWYGRCDDLVPAQPLGAIHEAIRSVSPAGDALRTALRTGSVPDVMVGLLEILQAGPPSVFVVEDIDSADDATLDVLGYLVRRAEEIPVLHVASYRPGEVARRQGLRRFLGSVPHRTTTITPAPLSRTAVRSLGDGRDVDALYEITGGNPFFVTEALATDGLGVPPTVSAAVAARLDALPTSCRVALERLAVCPGVIDFDLAEHLVGDLDVLAEAEQRGLLQVTVEGLSFRHEMARMATEAMVPRVRRRRLDAEVIAALRNRGEIDLPRLVHHAIRCGDADTVVAFAPQAAEYSARVGAHAQALAFYAATVRHEDRLSREQLGRTLDAYAWELHLAHRSADAVDAATRAVTLLADGPRAAHVAALVRSSRILFLAGAGADAIGRAAQALELSQGVDDDGSADALVVLGALHALVGDAAEGARLLDAAAAADPRPAVQSLVLTSQAQCHPGWDDEERLAAVRRAVAMAREDASYEPMTQAYAVLAELLYRFGRYDDLSLVLQEGLDVAREHGFSWHVPAFEAHQALLSCRRGDVDGGFRAFEALVARDLDPGLFAPYAAVPLARLRSRTGQRSAGQQLRDGWERALGHGLLLALGYAGAGLAEWGWLYGDRGVVEAVLRGWAPHAKRPTAAAFDAEIRRYARLAGVDDLSGLPGTRCTASLPADSPYAVSLLGDHAAAAVQWREIGDPYEAAIELAHSPDVADVREALRMLDRYGAIPAAHWVRGRLGALGVDCVPRGPQRRTRSNVAGLTRREAEVAALLLEGLTNAEIAARLVVSVRTVDHHVAAVLAKLGVNNRRAAIRRLATLPTAPEPAAPIRSNVQSIST